MNKKTGPCHVLLVSDSHAISTELKAILHPDYEVRVAANAVEALALAAHSQWLDIILIDDGLPDMDGADVCRRIKQTPATAETPVIFVSARKGCQDERRGFERTKLKKAMFARPTYQH